jgi:hypothetical protein
MRLLSASLRKSAGPSGSTAKSMPWRASADAPWLNVAMAMASAVAVVFIFPTWRRYNTWE